MLNHNPNGASEISVDLDAPPGHLGGAYARLLTTWPQDPDRMVR